MSESFISDSKSKLQKNTLNVPKADHAEEDESRVERKGGLKLLMRFEGNRNIMLCSFE
jgi:hypothetical protein